MTYRTASCHTATMFIRFSESILNSIKNINAIYVFLAGRRPKLNFNYNLEAIKLQTRLIQ